MANNVKINGTTYSGVSKVELENADSAGTYIEFTAGGGGIEGGYNITFKVDGNDWYFASIVQGDYLEKPANPTKAGYYFQGWGTTPDATTFVQFPVTPSADTTYYAIFVQAQVATVTGLGNSDPATVTFTRDANFPTTFETWTDGNNNVFVKIPTMYRKVLASSNGQITSFAIATGKVDEHYEVYPIFKDGNNILPYVCIGVYCYSDTTYASSSVSGDAVVAIGDARTMARAVGTGYQQYDLHFQKLFQDLALVISQTVNFNTGTTIENYMGIHNLDGYIWVDGIAGTGSAWVASDDPTKYADSPTSSTDGYYQLGYAQPTTSSSEIQALGYDTNHPFVNYPKTVTSNSSYNTYYCDGYYYNSGSHPVYSNVGRAYAYGGLWLCYASRSWTDTSRARLCYRPLAA